MKTYTTILNGKEYQTKTKTRIRVWVYQEAGMRNLETGKEYLWGGYTFQAQVYRLPNGNYIYLNHNKEVTEIYAGSRVKDA